MVVVVVVSNEDINDIDIGVVDVVVDVDTTVDELIIVAIEFAMLGPLFTPDGAACAAFIRFAALCACLALISQYFLNKYPVLKTANAVPNKNFLDDCSGFLSWSILFSAK